VARARPGSPGCRLCKGKGIAFLLFSDGRRPVECPECFPPPPAPLVSVGVSDRPWPPEEIPALRPVLDAVRAARRNGEA
jgi:hypothetical protein